MVEVIDVRRLLGNIDESLLDDLQILQALDAAKKYVSQYITTDNTLYDECVKYRAAYFAMITYAEIARREVGELPAAAETVMHELRTIADELLDAARKAVSTTATTLVPVVITDSRWTE